ERLRVVELDVSEADQPVSVLVDEGLCLVKSLGRGEQQGDAIHGIESCEQLFEEAWLAIVAHVRVHELGRMRLGEERRRAGQEQKSKKDGFLAHDQPPSALA